MVHILLKPYLENFEHYFSSMWYECSCGVVWAFLGIGMKTDLFQSFDHCWVFQFCWCIECSTFTSTSFGIWNSSTGIPSPPLALFIVMVPKPYLTLHSRMSGSRWVITPLWLSGSWIYFFLYGSSVHSCHLFLISSASVRSITLLYFIMPIFSWNFPLVSLIFLKRSLAFPILCCPLFLCIDHLGFLISPWYSLGLCIQMGISYLSPLPLAFFDLHFITAQCLNKLYRPLITANVFMQPTALIDPLLCTKDYGIYLRYNSKRKWTWPLPLVKLQPIAEGTH